MSNRLRGRQVDPFFTSIGYNKFYRSTAVFLMSLSLSAFLKQLPRQRVLQ